MTYPDALVASVHREVGVVPPPRFKVGIEVMGQLTDQALAETRWAQCFSDIS